MRKARLCVIWGLARPSQRVGDRHRTVASRSAASWRSHANAWTAAKSVAPHTVETPKAEVGRERATRRAQAREAWWAG